MAGLAPAIHVFFQFEEKDVDARHKAGHDEHETLGAYFIRQIGQILSRDIDLYRWPGLASTRTMFVGPRGMTGSQTACGSGGKIIAVRRYHHALLGLEIERLAGGKINARFRFVVAGNFRTKDRVPWKIIAPREIHHQ